MQAGFKDQFTVKWEKYFPSAQLPVCFYYTDNQVAADTMQPLPGSRCFIHELERVRQGESLVFTGSDIGCFGYSWRLLLGRWRRLHDYLWVRRLEGSLGCRCPLQQNSGKLGNCLHGCALPCGKPGQVQIAAPFVDVLGAPVNGKVGRPATSRHFKPPSPAKFEGPNYHETWQIPPRRGQRRPRTRHIAT